MEAYANRSGDSAVRAYEFDATSIAVEFQNRRAYLYDYGRPGRNDVERMKALAVSGRGLGTFISKVVKKRYARKLPR